VKEKIENSSHNQFKSDLLSENMRKVSRILYGLRISKNTLYNKGLDRIERSESNQVH